METACLTIFVIGLGFAVGAWLRSHPIVACLVGLAVTQAFVASAKAGDLLAPVFVGSVGMLLGAFRREISPFWAWCRRSLASAGAAGFDRVAGGRAGADAGPDPWPEPSRASFFGAGPTSEERQRREAEADRARRDQERAKGEAEAAEKAGWKRENDERERRERAESEARENAAREERAKRERDEAEAKSRCERQEREGRERAGKSGTSGDEGRSGADEAKRRQAPQPGSREVEAALEVLGVGPSANPQAVKKAYRKMALRWHPDRNQGDRQAEDAFKRVQAAYEALRAAGKV